MGRKNKSSAKAPVAANSNKSRPGRTSQQHRDLEDLIDKLLRVSTIPQHQNILKSLENQREISGITDKVKQLEKSKEVANGASFDVGNPACGSAVDAFLKWCLENGAQLNGCTITHYPGYGLGLRADLDIPQSSLVIAVPRKIMLSIETANQGILKGLVEKDKILGSMPNVTLAILLLVEKFKDTKSFWKPYIDILPKSYTTVLYFNVEELEELKGSPTLEIALRQIKSISRQYAYFHKLFLNSADPVSELMRGRFTYNEYCWAVSTIMTRQNTIPFQEDYHALIPLWDLCNHTNGTISTAYNPVLDRSECLAFKDFKAGEQLFIFYGGRSNADLFIHNGFVYEDNEYDSYWIRLGISRLDPLQEKRSELLNKLSLSTTGDFCIRKGAKPVEGQLLAFLRIFNMNAEQLDHWIKSDKSGDLQYLECALDTSLEKKSWAFLQARLKLLLSAYKTTLEQDEKILEETAAVGAADGVTSSLNRLLAVRMRATEKRIIRDTLEYVEQYIKQ